MQTPQSPAQNICVLLSKIVCRRSWEVIFGRNSYTADTRSRNYLRSIYNLLRLGVEHCPGKRMLSSTARVPPPRRHLGRPAPRPARAHARRPPPAPAGRARAPLVAALLCPAPPLPACLRPASAPLPPPPPSLRPSSPLPLCTRPPGGCARRRALWRVSVCLL